MLAIHTLVRLPDATLLSSVPGAGPALGGGGKRRGSEIGPSLPKTPRTLASRPVPRSTTSPGDLRERTRGCPLRQHPRRSRASVAERLLKAAQSALNPFPWSSDP